MLLFRALNFKHPVNIYHLIIGRIVNVASMAGRISQAQNGIYNMTKHSMIAFTDTLRRELYKYNVKVSSIEPAVFRTGLTTDETWSKQMDDLWNESSDEAKAYYGSPHKVKASNLGSLKSMPIENNIDVAVDDMIDAITNSRPKLIYTPMRLSLKLVMNLMYYLPPEVIDFILRTFELLSRMYYQYHIIQHTFTKYHLQTRGAHNRGMRPFWCSYTLCRPCYSSLILLRKLGKVSYRTG